MHVNAQAEHQLHLCRGCDRNFHEQQINFHNYSGHRRKIGHRSGEKAEVNASSCSTKNRFSSQSLVTSTPINLNVTNSSKSSVSSSNLSIEIPVVDRPHNISYTKEVGSIVFNDIENK